MKKYQIRNNLKWIKWLQYELNRLRAIKPRTLAIKKKITSYNHNMGKRKEKVNKSKKRILKLGGTI